LFAIRLDADEEGLMDDNLARALLYAICRQTAVQTASFNTEYNLSLEDIEQLALRWYKEALKVGEQNTLWSL
jgi:hypothetical protein